MSDAKLTVGLIGNPNCGKTALFNCLTKGRQRVGNWPGVTVDQHRGELVFADQKISVIDLPGCYTCAVASADSPLDEQIACQFLLSEQVDVYVNVIDACHLQRHLYLTLQLLETGVPVVVALNMMDVADKQGIEIDQAALARHLGCPVVAMVANRGEGAEALCKAICHAAAHPHCAVATPLPTKLSQALTELGTQCRSHLAGHLSERWVAMRLLEGDHLVQAKMSAELILATTEIAQQLAAEVGEEADILIADARYQAIQRIVERVWTRQAVHAGWSATVDALVLNRWLGVPVFLGVMYALFFFTMHVGGMFQESFEILGRALFVDGVGVGLQQFDAPDWLLGLLAHGVGEGMVTAISFIPILAAMFFGLTWLEDSGYMARAAFVVDRAMRALGLPGKAFVAMIVGFGCNVPAVMATRTLENQRDRILTALMTPFMSCSARLAVYAVFVAAFFPVQGHNVIFLLYMIGIVIAVISGLLLRASVLPGEVMPLVMEMPAYHWPQWRAIARRTGQRLSGFMRRAMVWIIPLCAGLGLLTHVPFGQDSLLSWLGRGVTRVFVPMGLNLDNWPATVGLIMGAIAKEVVIGTLNSLYQQLAAHQLMPVLSWQPLEAMQLAWQSLIEHAQALPSGLSTPIASLAPAQNLGAEAYGQLLRHFTSTASVFAYLLFILLYFPCISTMAAIRRELSLGWAVFSLLWANLLAYGIAVGYFQLATWSQHPTQSATWVTAITLCFAGLFMGLRWLTQPPSWARRKG